MRQLYRLLQQYSNDKSILPKGNLGKAVRYALNEAPGILHCLKSGDYSLDNNNIDPYQYLADVLKRINGHCHKNLAELLPNNWKPLENLKN